MELKRINVWSATKIFTAISAVTGIPIVGVQALSGYTATGGYGTYFVLLALVMYVLFVLGSGVTVALSTWLYNLFAKRMGGVELEMS